MLNIDHLVFCRAYRVDKFVEFEINGAGIAVLRVLDEKDHEKCDDGRACVDDELPGIGIVVDGARNRPDDDDADGDEEGPLRAQIDRGIGAEASESGFR